jgi:hypothetical protein
LLGKNIHHLLLGGTNCIPDVCCLLRGLMLRRHSIFAELILLLPDVIDHRTMFIFFVLFLLFVLLLPFLPLFLKVVGGIANLGTLWSYPRRLNNLRLDAIGRDWLYLNLLLIV